MKITTERAEELAAQREYQEDYRCAEAIRALTKERDEQANEIAILKTIIRNLEARDIHSCGPDCPRSGCVNRRLREQLAAAQAVIAKKDEALKNSSALVWRKDWRNAANRAELCSLLRTALALHSDDTALREMLAEQREKSAILCEKSDRYRGDYFAALLRAEAEKLRKQPAQVEEV